MNVIGKAICYIRRRLLGKPHAWRIAKVRHVVTFTTCCYCGAKFSVTKGGKP